MIFVEDKERAESAMGGAEAAALAKSTDNKEKQEIVIWVSNLY